MNQMFRQSALGDPDRSGDADLASSSTGVRPLSAPTPEQAFFHVDIKRSLQLHWRLARAVAMGFVVLAMLYIFYQVFVRKSWPTYLSESIVYVQPTPAKVLPAEPGPQRWPYDTNTYETYIQQQMMNVSREDVLINAVHKLPGFQGPGESDQSAAQRMVATLEVTREGSAYQFSISARSRDPQLAADIANAVTASYIESASRDERTGDAQRLTMLNEEKNRIQTALTAERVEQEALNKQLGVASVSTATPDHYDEDITQIRGELAKARTDHDIAEQKFASLGAGRGSSSSAIDAAADEMIASDAGLVSMKTALNTRRATIISQMSNLTPSHPQYKQDELELTKINTTLEAMMKDLRAKAAARIQLQLRADLQRTAGVESQLNGQLRQLAGAASGATPKLQRSSDLAADITRLQARYATVDEQLHNLMIEDNAPAAAYQVSPAVAPLTRTKSGVMRNAIMIAFAGLFFGVIAAVAAHKLDPKIYIAADVQQVLGFAPLAQLPNFAEVSEGVSEEYILRLASAIEHARKQGNLKNCIFTGTGSGTGVTTLVNRVSAMLEAMGRPTVLVDATGAQAPAPRPGASGREGAQGLVPVMRVSRPTALLQQMAEETETQEESLVLTDTAPLSVSAETEYLARFVDCAIVIVESGVTTRAQLREVAATLERLNVGAVGFVLNRVGLAMADPAFRLSVEAVEKHLQSHGKKLSMLPERSSSFAPGPSKTKEPLPNVPNPRSKFEPEVAAVAAAVARFSPRPVSNPPSTTEFCPASPAPSSRVADAVKRFSLPLYVESVDEPAKAAPSPSPVAIVAEPVKTASEPQLDEPVTPVSVATPTAPFVEAAKHFETPVTAETPAPNPPPAVPEQTEVASAIPAPATTETPAPIEASSQPSNPEQTAASQAPDLPWWLSDAPRHTEPSRPPVIWQPAKVWTASKQLENASTIESQSLTAHSQQSPAAPATTQADPGPDFKQTPEDRTSRLSGLRNLLFVLGVKDAHSTDEADEQHAGGSSNFDSRVDRLSAERAALEAQERSERSIGGASTRLVTAPPEFLPPKSVVIEFNKPDARVGESSTRQDRRAAADGVEILPSKRGQYKKL